ncbi:hypothetical protein HDV00_005406 [Rhizophlyctis rosea]|nr:hypothetical protein HDV00_005406 [Rhizophlyctis rosea]
MGKESMNDTVVVPIEPNNRYPREDFEARPTSAVPSASLASPSSASPSIYPPAPVGYASIPSHYAKPPFNPTTDGDYMAHFFIAFGTAWIWGIFTFCCFAYRPRGKAKNLYHAAAFCAGCGAQYVCVAIICFGLMAPHAYGYFGAMVLVPVGLFYTGFAVGAFMASRRYWGLYEKMMAGQGVGAAGGVVLPQYAPVHVGGVVPGTHAVGVPVLGQSWQSTAPLA